MAHVKTPVAGYNGLVGADQFIDGECVIPDGRLAYYERHGYIIIRDEAHVGNDEASKPDDSAVSNPEPPIMPGKEAPKIEWEEFARSVGVDPAEKTKNEIIAAVKEAMQPVSDNQG